MVVTKLDAARRHIDAAVRLYFEDGDETAVHTLVGAAHSLITDLSSAAKIESILDRCVVPNKRWEFEKAIRAPQNFFKHAKKDHGQTLDFNPHFSELQLLIDIEMFKELSGSATDAMRAFLMYASATWGKEFTVSPEDALEGLSAIAAQRSKLEFLQLCQALIARGRNAEAT